MQEYGRGGAGGASSGNYRNKNRDHNARSNYRTPDRHLRETMNSGDLNQRAYGYGSGAVVAGGAGGGGGGL